MNRWSRPRSLPPREVLSFEDEVAQDINTMVVESADIDELAPDHPLRQAYLEQFDIRAKNKYALADLQEKAYRDADIQTYRAWQGDERNVLMLFRHPVRMIKGMPKTAVWSLTKQKHESEERQSAQRIRIIGQMARDLCRGRTVDEVIEDAELYSIARSSDNGDGERDLSTEAYGGSARYEKLERFIGHLAAALKLYDSTDC